MIWAGRGQGATETWTGGSDNWATAANWDSGAGPVPAAGDTALIADSDGFGRMITYDYIGSAVTLSGVTIDNDGGGSDTLRITDNDALTSSFEYVGDSGASSDGVGTLAQTNGTNTTNNWLYIALDATDSGTYQLSGAGTLSVGAGEVVGYQGQGSFGQTGGANKPGSLFLGYFGGGSYNLDGGSLSVSLLEIVGFYGTGAFNQTSGTNTASGGVYLGGQSGTSGSYTLGGDGSLATGVEYAGYNGTGTFIQTGGTNTASSGLYLGGLMGSSGSYTLEGTGSLSAGREFVGQSGSGTFTQSGTTTNAVSGDLYIGDASIGAGQYTLSGPGGVLSIGGNAYIGGSDSAAGGSGQLNNQGGQLTVGGTLEVWNSTGTEVLIGGGATSAGNTVNLALIDQTGGTSSLGAVSGAGSISVGDVSGTSASMTVSAVSQHALTIESTGLFTMLGGASNNALNLLTINGSGAFDVTNGHFFLNYSGVDPVSAIRGYLTSGYNGGNWNGPGIESSTAAANTRYAVGYADSADAGNPAHLSSNQIEVKYTLYGDTNLDGTVNSIDFGNLAANFGKSGKAWDQGDFDYNGTVNSIDFGLLASNFGKSGSGAALQLSASDWVALDAFAEANGLESEVPEPGSVCALGIGGIVLLAQRRRKRRDGHPAARRG
jgi:hypothetical protein